MNSTIVSVIKCIVAAIGCYVLYVIVAWLVAALALPGIIVTLVAIILVLGWLVYVLRVFNIANF